MKTNCNIIECCNNTYQGAPLTRKQTIHTGQYSTILFTQNMHVELKIVTSNPQVMRKNRSCKNVLRMQYQPQACASDLGDGSHVTRGSGGNSNGDGDDSSSSILFVVCWFSFGWYSYSSCSEYLSLETDWLLLHAVQLVSSFQQEALTKQQDADTMWSKLSNVRRMIAKLLKTMNDVREIFYAPVIPVYIFWLVLQLVWMTLLGT